MVDLPRGKKLSPGGPERLRFGQIVGQDELKEALLAVAAADGLDGLLVRGEKGTAKSTAVRGLVDLLPEQRTVADCPFGCPPDHDPAAPGAQCADCRERDDPPVETRPVPLVTLPLGATRERVVGSLSVADALDGDPEFDPGLLARAHRGVLYVDEVNLLDDHLVDVLLDAAASGVNRVERDGVSVAHPAEFTLIGTMNPEEGDLRPQLRDRFALQATVTGSEDVDERVAIIDRALGEDADSLDSEAASESKAKVDGVQDATARHRDRLLDARDRLPDVALPAEFKRRIAEICRDAGVEGHRADVATARAARALAALDDRPRVLESDVRRAAELSLPHRLQSRPFEDAPDPEDVLEDHFDDDADGGDGEGEDAESGEGGRDESERGDVADDEAADAGSADESPDEGGDSTDSGCDDESGRPEGGDSDGASGDDGSGPDGAGSGRRCGPDGAGAGSTDGASGIPDESNDDPGADDPGADDPDDADETATPLLPGQQRAGIGDARAPSVDAEAEPAEDRPTEIGGGGSRRGVASASGDGARIRTERASAEDAVDAAASVRAAAARGADAVESRDLRRSVRSANESALVVFALDASASMRGPMRAAKGVVMDLLRDAYEQRDEVAVVAFAGEDADVLLPPTDSVSAAARLLKELPTADRTPLPAGLDAAAEVLERADPAVGVVVLVTDGRANAGDESPTAATREAARRLAAQGDRAVVVDAGDPSDRSALTADVARICGGDRVPLDELTPERVEDAVARAHNRG